jgi:hypothetical protein
LGQLREKADFGTLTKDERAKYEEFIAAMDLAAILKAEALTVLENHSQWRRPSYFTAAA